MHVCLLNTKFGDIKEENNKEIATQGARALNIVAIEAPRIGPGQGSQAAANLGHPYPLDTTGLQVHVVFLVVEF